MAKKTMTQLHYSNLTVTQNIYRWYCYCCIL